MSTRSYVETNLTITCKEKTKSPFNTHISKGKNLPIQTNPEFDRVTVLVMNV